MDHKLTRRDFIKGAAAAGVSLGLCYCGSPEKKSKSDADIQSVSTPSIPEYLLEFTTGGVILKKGHAASEVLTFVDSKPVGIVPLQTLPWTAVSKSDKYNPKANTDVSLSAGGAMYLFTGGPEHSQIAFYDFDTTRKIIPKIIDTRVFYEEKVVSRIHRDILRSLEDVINTKNPQIEPNVGDWGVYQGGVYRLFESGVKSSQFDDNLRAIIYNFASDTRIPFPVGSRNPYAVQLDERLLIAFISDNVLNGKPYLYLFDNPNALLKEAHPEALLLRATKSDKSVEEVLNEVWGKYGQLIPVPGGSSYSSLKVASTGTRLACIKSEKTDIYDISNIEYPHILDTVSGVNASFSADGTKVVVEENGVITAYDISNKQPKALYRFHGSGPSFGGNMLGCLAEGNIPVVFHPETETAAIFPSEPGWMSSRIVMKNDREFALELYDNSIKRRYDIVLYPLKPELFGLQAEQRDTMSNK